MTRQPVIDFEDYYEVSDTGDVFRTRVSNNTFVGRKLKSRCNNNGYPYVVLCKNGIRTTKTIHRLVAQSFIPNPNNYPEINHRNCDKADNRVSNLEWCTTSHNRLHAHNNGRHKGTLKARRPIKATHITTGEIITFKSMAEATQHGFATSSICCCCRKRQPSHKQYTWEYINE